MAGGGVGELGVPLLLREAQRLAGAPLGGVDVAPAEVVVGQVALGHQGRRPGPRAAAGVDGLLQHRCRLVQLPAGVEGDAQRQAADRPLP